MSTLDANGIMFLEETDAISPFHTLINGMQQATSDAITATTPVPPEQQVFTASGTWTKPSGAKRVQVVCVGGGGAGGGCTSGTGQAEGSCGGGGGTAIKLFNADDLAATITVTVGAGGTGVSGANGNSGSASSFGTLTANGGGFGRASGTVTSDTATVGGSGGTATGGTVNITGADGSNGRVLAGKAVLCGRSGSSTHGLSVNQPTGAGNGVSGTGYGSGGSGAFGAGSAHAGGAGRPGIVIVTTYF